MEGPDETVYSCIQPYSFCIHVHIGTARPKQCRQHLIGPTVLAIHLKVFRYTVYLQVLE